MTANIIPDVEDAFPDSGSGSGSGMTLSPMYTVPKFSLNCLHHTEIHFRSSTYKANVQNSKKYKNDLISNRHGARERQGDILVVEEGQFVLGTISRVIILIRFL